MSDDIQNKLDDILGSLVNNTHVEPYNNYRFVGIGIYFSIKGFGFGEISLSYDKEKKVYKADTECMSAETVEKILIMAAPKLAKLMVELDQNPKAQDVEVNS